MSQYLPCSGQWLSVVPEVSHVLYTELNISRCSDEELQCFHTLQLLFHNKDFFNYLAQRNKTHTHTYKNTQYGERCYFKYCFHL